jgi:hypothetical protein
MTSLVDGGGQITLGLWQAITPVAGTNLVTNPSFELGTAGWVTSAGALARTAGAGVFGAYGGRLLASSTNGNTYFDAGTVSAGTIVTASVWIKSDSPLVQLWLNDGIVNQVVSHPGDNQWHRLEATYTWTSTTFVRVYVIDTRTSSWSNVDFDGVQVETGVTAASTYIDGDQDGCSWTGTPHASTSTRDGRDGRGGAITTIDQPGYAAAGSYQVREFRGIGMPEFNVISTDLALADGGSYQRSRGQSRSLSLFYILQGNGTPAGLHTARRSLLSILNPDKRTNRGPITLRYIGSSSPRIIAAYYAGGLEWGEVKGLTEEPEVKFTAPDPIWQSETEESAGLTSSLTVTPVSNFAYRLPDGSWSSMAGGSTASPLAQIGGAVKLLDGRVVVMGRTEITNLGGVAAADGGGIWDGVAWSNIGGAAANAPIFSMALGNDGTLYIGGTFTSISGVAINRIARWDSGTNTFSVLGTGGANGSVDYLAIDPTTGYLWAAGSFGNIGGVGAAGIAYWDGSTWVAAHAGLTLTPSPNGITAGPDGRMYVGIGAYTPGPGPLGLFVWTGSAWSQVATTVGSILAMASYRGSLIVAGTITSIGGVTVSNIAQSTNGGWATMGGGIVGDGVYWLGVTPDGLLYASGKNWSSVGGIVPPDSLATWNGSTWVPSPVNPPDTGTHANDVYRMVVLRDGSMLLNWATQTGTGTFGTTLTAEAITSITNSGSANAYPVIDIAGPGTLYSIANLTTGQRISFSGCTLATSETARLDLRPGRKTFVGLLRQLISTILPGSDLSTFCLVPGVNRIAVYDTGGTMTTHWKPRYWAAD